VTVPLAIRDQARRRHGGPFAQHAMEDFLDNTA